MPKRVWDGAGNYSSCSKILFDDYSGFYEMRSTLILSEEQNNNRYCI